MIRRLLCDRISQLDARLHRLDSRLSELAELTEQGEVRTRQQRDRQREIITELRTRFDSGTPELEF